MNNMVGDALKILAYAEVRAIMLAWAGRPAWSPQDRARSTVLAVLAEGCGDKELVTVTQARLREESQMLLAHRHEPWPYDGRLGHGQLGNAEGIEKVFHLGAAEAWVYREKDPRMLSLAVSLAEIVRRARGVNADASGS